MFHVYQRRQYKINLKQLWSWLQPSVIRTREVSVSIRKTASGVALTNSDLNNSELGAHILFSPSHFLPFKIHKSSQNGGHGQKQGGTTQVENLACCERNKQLCLCYFPLWAEVVQVQNIRVLTKWWMKHGKVVSDCKGSENLFQSTNKWKLHIVAITDALA